MNFENSQLESQSSSQTTAQANSIFVIAPYWSSGTWVFDDLQKGLHREPFVAGVPAILTELVREIPNATAGFRLLFSPNPFPGFHARYRRDRAETSGTWYKTEDGREGWLCPALFKYFSQAPKEIYVRVEPLD